MSLRLQSVWNVLACQERVTSGSVRPLSVGGQVGSRSTFGLSVTIAGCLSRFGCGEVRGYPLHCQYRSSMISKVVCAVLHMIGNRMAGKADVVSKVPSAV